MLPAHSTRSWRLTHKTRLKGLQRFSETIWWELPEFSFAFSPPDLEMKESANQNANRVDGNRKLPIKACSLSSRNQAAEQTSLEKTLFSIQTPQKEPAPRPWCQQRLNEDMNGPPPPGCKETPPLHLPHCQREPHKNNFYSQQAVRSSALRQWWRRPVRRRGHTSTLNVTQKFSKEASWGCEFSRLLTVMRFSLLLMR